tara:strand:+ start:1608 stop:1970 length:363 start_codon:yes stop_codon:yes gene_type:complete
MNNAIMLISPYKYSEQWVFDDENTGLVREPFVSGADQIIDQMVASIDDPASGFNLLFSDKPFPGHGIMLERRQPESGGYWYHSESLGMDGWLCPALFKYFDEAPEKLYASATPKWSKAEA